MDFRVNGVHVNRSTGTADYRQALEIEERIKANLRDPLDKGAENCPSQFTLSQALDEVYNWKWRANRTGDRPYRQVLTIIELVEDLTLDKLSGDKGHAVLREIKTLLSEDRGPVTVDRYLAALKTLLITFRDEKPCGSLSIPKFPMNNKERRRERFLSEEEEKELLGILDKSHSEYADLFRVLVDTGLRLSEALSLDYRKNISFEKDMITVYSTNTKSGRPRSVPMTQRVKEVLERRRHVSYPKPFPMTPTRADQVWAQAKIKMGLGQDRDFVPHILRHTCTTRLLQKGVPQLIVQNWLGHSDGKMTAHYAHFCVEDMRSGAKLLDAFGLS